MQVYHGPEQRSRGPRARTGVMVYIPHTDVGGDGIPEGGELEVVMSPSRHRRLIGALVLPAFVLALTAHAGAAPPTDPAPPDLSAEMLTPSGTISASKAATSRLAQTDPALLGRTDATPVAVMIKLDYDSAATYAGGIAGVPATSPSVTGKPLSGKSAAEQAHANHAASQEAAFKSALATSAPQARVGQSFRTVYGGVQAVVPANKVADVLAIGNVVAVQSDSLNQPLTDASTEFIGANSLYPSLGGDSNAGAGVIFGVLDTGGWPEHPSFADQGNLGAPPAKADGTPRACDFGDNPLTPATDVFACNNKLIGGQAFLATYLSNPDRAAAELYHTARDSNGHGTHTGSTSAGNVVASAPVFGVNRGPINGVAPGAWVSVYKVCGIEGCFDSDSAAAVQQAILDGVDVINFSISGGTDPFSDPVELAFLDAYAAGVFVSASAGNDGPGAGTANHLSAWTTSVAASTQTREFRSHLTVTGASGTYEVDGVSIGSGSGAAPLPVVLSSAAPYSRPLCDAPAPAGLFTGKIVACQRGVNARVEKGYNVLQGGAAGMILYNLPPTTDVETDNHWLPTVHLANGQQLVAFINANPGSTAQFTAGIATEGRGDVMASFSSRGPAGPFIKPDITAPGVQILAGHTPTPESVLEGPPGEYFQAIAGTSMSSPHIAGSAVLLRALHPEWSPMEIRSAMMLTAKTSVVKENGSTPANPFDTGAGRVDLTVAGSPGLVMDESAQNMFGLAASAATGVHLNQPSINAPVMPGRLVTTRTFTNVTPRAQRYRAETTAPPGSRITVSPSDITVGFGESKTVTITIESSAPTAQYFGEIRLVPITAGNDAATKTLHLPVAFVPQQGGVSLASHCDGATLAVNASTTCDVTATNTTFNDITVNLRTTVNDRLRITGATGATVAGGAASTTVALAGGSPGVPSVDPGGLFGYVPLSDFGVTPIAVGDESILNFNVPAFSYNGNTYNAIGVDSNGYVVVGGADAEDNNCCNLPDGPDPAMPNDMLAPFWTDLDGTGAEGIRVAVLRAGANRWVIVEWQVNVWGTTSNRHFQVWIGLNGAQDITFAYDPEAMPADPNGQEFGVGAENELGAGDVVFGELPTEDLRVTSSDPVDGASYTYTVDVLARRAGAGVVRTEMTGPDLPGGTTVVVSNITVN